MRRRKESLILRLLWQAVFGKEDLMHTVPTRGAHAGVLRVRHHRCKEQDVNIEQEIKAILHIPGVVEASLWGSRYILPEHDQTDCKDWDVLVLGAAQDELMSAGFEVDCSAAYSDAKFLSLRKGDLNIVLVHDSKFYDLCLASAEVCKASHRAGATDMRHKVMRIAVHRILRGEA